MKGWRVDVPKEAGRKMQHDRNFRKEKPFSESGTEEGGKVNVKYFEVNLREVMYNSCGKGLGELSAASDEAGEALGSGCGRKDRKARAVGTLREG